MPLFSPHRLFAPLLLTTCLIGCPLATVPVYGQDNAAKNDSVDIEWLNARGVDQPVTPDQTGLDVDYTLDGKEVHAFIPPAADTSLWKDGDNPNGAGTSILLRDGRFSEGLVQFDLSALPKGAVVTAASLQFKVGGVEDKGQPGKLSIYRILTPWNEAEATWHKPQATAPDWNGMQAGRDYDATPITELQVDVFDDKKPGQFISIPHFEDALKQWQSGAWPNNGFLIALNGKALQFSFASREAAWNTHDVLLGGATDGKLLLVPNEALFPKLLIKADDLLGALPQITIEKSKPNLTPSSDGTINLYAIKGTNTALRELIGSIPLKSLPPILPNAPGVPTPPTALPDITKKLKAWLAANDNDSNLLVTLAGATNELTIGGPLHGPAQPSLSLSIRSYPAVHLFSVPFGWKPGVYTKIVDGHLNYDGKRLRLWGVVGYPDVDRLVNCGFNAQRVWEPSGKLGKDTDHKVYTTESAAKGEYAPYTKGDGSQLDIADKHFADLKSHGMFVMLGALTATIPYEPLYADGSFISGGDDWEQWKAAMQTPKAGNPYHYIFVDDRLQKIKMQGAKNLLTHVNPYTGKAYGEEENIALYEVYNENGFVLKMLSGGLDQWPPYFKTKMQAKWNAWLVKHYTDDAGLTKAWGKLDTGESLANGTVHPGPTFEDRLKYPEARAEDYVHFMIDLENDFNQTFRSYCRSLFPAGVGVNVIPFSFDTMYRPNLPWAYTDCLGDVFSYGMYYWDLKSSLDRPPGSYLIDSFTVDQKPTVLYETNVGRPNAFRSEYPIKLAAMASYQDWDGVFWHYWSPVKNGEDNLSYLNGTLLPPMSWSYWSAVQNQTDPVMGTSVALAGRIFLGGYLPPAEVPKAFPLSQKSIFSYSGFHGINLAPFTFTQGSKIEFKPDDAGVAGDDMQPVAGRLQNAVAAGKYITWDWPKARLIIDAPNVKAYVGVPDGMFRFSDGITLGKVSSPWIAFVLESSDGKPLLGPGATSKILMGAVADAKNTGFSFNYNVIGGVFDQIKAVHSLGHLPVLVDKVEYTVWFPNQFKGTFKSYDFALREIHSTPIMNGNEIDQKGPTPFIDAVNIDSWGAGGTLPVATPTKIVTDNPAPLTVSTADATAASVLKGSDLVQPIPGLDWNMDYVTAHKFIENSVLTFTTEDELDKSAAVDKTMTITDLQLNPFWNNATDVIVSFHNDHITSIEITLKSPPPAEDLVTKFTAFLGEPYEKKLDAQYGTTRISWKGRDITPDLTVTESQGVMKLLFQPHTETDK